MFLECLEPSGLHAEDLDTGRLVTRFQSGETEAFADIYIRYFDRVYRYLKVVLTDAAEAEDATQQVFTRALEALPRYEHLGSPVRAWLFRIARNQGVDHLRRMNRLEPLDPEDLDRVRDEPSGELGTLDWITDRELVMFIERLPLPQRQVLMLRFTIGLSNREVATLLDRSPADVRMLQSRALRYLRERLEAVGRGGSYEGRSRMRRWPREAPVLRARRWSLSG
jgi:RNA polymerase sigma-70 factor (ECF subfamily)